MISFAVRPVAVCGCDAERGARFAAGEVGRKELFEAVFLRVARIFRIGTGYHDAAIVEEDGFGVIQTCDSGVGHHGHALVDGLAGIVEYGVQVWIGC